MCREAWSASPFVAPERSADGCSPASHLARPAAPGPVRAFLAIEAAGGIVLPAATALALVWANSPWAEGYRRLVLDPLAPLGVDLHHGLGRWVNDELMALFFFVVGLEIKRGWWSASSATDGPPPLRRSPPSAGWWSRPSSTRP